MTLEQLVTKRTFLAQQLTYFIQQTDGTNVELENEVVNLLVEMQLVCNLIHLQTAASEPVDSIFDNNVKVHNQLYQNIMNTLYTSKNDLPTPADPDYTVGDLTRAVYANTVKVDPLKKIHEIDELVKSQNADKDLVEVKTGNGQSVKLTPDELWRTACLASSFKTDTDKYFRVRCLGEFNKFLKDSNVYEEWVKNWNKEFSEYDTPELFLLSTPPKHWINRAFSWSKHEQVNWIDVHYSWTQCLKNLNYYDQIS